MDIWDVLKLAGFLLLLAFIVFAFRQGMKVKPDKDARDRGGGYDGNGSGGGHDGGGGHGGGH
jgi:hypothetical protein